MRDRRGREGSRRIAWLTASLVLGGLARADPPSVRLSGVAGMAVRRAIEGASLRLERPDCRRVYSDFRDGAGRTLQEALGQHGETPASYLRSLVFHDGASEPRCASGEILGGTRTGSRVVYVCPLQFYEAYRRDTFLAEAFIIHETLHSLGLGEKPPASIEITRRVMRRCPGRVPLP